MRTLLALFALLALVACGADGEPEPVTPGVTFSGEAAIGVKYRG